MIDADDRKVLGTLLVLAGGLSFVVILLALVLGIAVRVFEVAAG
jgi:hypothetical protein